MRLRLGAMVGALFLLIGLASPATALSLEAQRTAPATQPQNLPAWDWLGTIKCSTLLLPNLPKENKEECVKKVLKDIDETAGAVKDGASAVATAVANSILGDAAEALAEFGAEFLRVTFSWWLMTDSVQVADSGVLGDPDHLDDPTRSLSLHGLMLGIGAGIATLLAMLQGIKMIIQRKGAPLAQILQGLLTNVVVSAASVGVIDALLIASDQLTKAILYVGFGGGTDIPAHMAAVMLPTIGNPMGLLMVGLISLFVGGTQAVMLFLRQAAIPIQALLYPIAAAGQVGGQNSQQWLPRLFTGSMVIIVYKPTVGLILAVGFTEQIHGEGIIDFVRGVVTMVLSIIALKSLLGIFTPLGISMANSVSAAGGFAGALSMLGGAAISQMGGAGGDGKAGADGSGGGGSTAASHAADMERNRPQGGGNDGPDEGSSAVQQASTIPQQGSGRDSGADSPEPETTSTTAQTGQATGGGSASTQTAGQVGIALVAAEAGRQTVSKAGGAVGGTE
ncbi:hypothetical protein OH717_34045 (plasmid) [Streptomyces albidoflavus]|nr:hypothetical protein OH717_34215 [Streptomyces albidoflavus]WTD07624.1 hypothetical protein OH717_34045 [Streptomyces albidoflavus]